MLSACIDRGPRSGEERNSSSIDRHAYVTIHFHSVAPPSRGCSTRHARTRTTQILRKKTQKKTGKPDVGEQLHQCHHQAWRLQCHSNHFWKCRLVLFFLFFCHLVVDDSSEREDEVVKCSVSAPDRALPFCLSIDELWCENDSLFVTTPLATV